MKWHLNFHSSFNSCWLSSRLSSVSFDPRYSLDNFITNSWRKDYIDNISLIDLDKYVEIILEISCDIINLFLIKFMDFSSVIFHKWVSISCIVEINCILSRNISLIHCCTWFYCYILYSICDQISYFIGIWTLPLLHLHKWKVKYLKKLTIHLKNSSFFYFCCINFSHTILVNK